MIEEHSGPRPCRAVLWGALALAATAAAQDAPPATDIHLAAIVGDSADLRLGVPTPVTDRPGYDNQPHFLPGGRALVYTSIRDGQADIYLYDLAAGTHRQVTATPESEYSPTPIPGSGAAPAISVVRVEADGRQRLWRFPLGGGEPELLLPGVEPVGYHAWGEATHLGLFVLGEPPTLQRVDLGGEPKVVAKDIGRALHKIPGRSAISFIHKESTEIWWVKRLDLETGEIHQLVRTFAGREDVTWSPSGELWMADGSRLYRWSPRRGGEPSRVADLAEHGIREVTRLAIDPAGSRLALVAARGK